MDFYEKFNILTYYTKFKKKLTLHTFEYLPEYTLEGPNFTLFCCTSYCF